MVLMHSPSGDARAPTGTKPSLFNRIVASSAIYRVINDYKRPVDLANPVDMPLNEGTSVRSFLDVKQQFQHLRNMDNNMKFRYKIWP